MHQSAIPSATYGRDPKLAPVGARAFAALAPLTKSISEVIGKRWMAGGSWPSMADEVTASICDLIDNEASHIQGGCVLTDPPDDRLRDSLVRFATAYYSAFEAVVDQDDEDASLRLNRLWQHIGPPTVAPAKVNPHRLVVLRVFGFSEWLLESGHIYLVELEGRLGAPDWVIAPRIVRAGDEVVPCAKFHGHFRLVDESDRVGG